MMEVYPLDRPSTDYLEGIKKGIKDLASFLGREIRIMEVCGTHTVSIFRSGIRSLLPKNIRLISGPGCPVCVTTRGEIDMVVKVLEMGYAVATFGDLMRVPGSKSSLYRERAKGRRVFVVTSPLDVLKIKEKVVFAAVGFETTAPATAVLARESWKNNFLILSLHRIIPPALRAVLEMGPSIDGFLLPGHVSAIIGASPYRFLADEFGRPGVVAGFEPGDILEGIYAILKMLAEGRPGIEIQYSRVVREEGNERAKKLIGEVFSVVDVEWRGLGLLPGSGLKLKEEFSHVDAEKVLDLAPVSVKDPKGCICGEVITGSKTPLDCPMFGRRCTPLDPLGPCMVSSEGTCAAYFKYGGFHGR